MAHADEALFRSERARSALEKYGAVTQLSVQVYGLDHRALADPTHPTPLFQLFARGDRQSDSFLDRLRPPPGEPRSPIVTEQYGVATVTAGFRLDGELMCMALAGPVLVAHVTHRDVEQIARASGMPFDTIWMAARRELPVPRQRLELYGELLQVVGETLLSDSYRSHRLEEALARLEAADRAKDLFLATLSHELRTPLTAIVGWTRVLRTGNPGAATLAQGLDVIERNTKLQVRLIEDLLDVSRAIVGKIDLDLQPVRLHSVMEAALDAVRPAAEAKRILLDAALDASGDLVLGDRDRLGQMVSNLLTNALKFTPEGGKIEVGLRRVDSQAEIRVSDTGAGIAPEFLPRLFERFRQASPSVSHGGLGLGLALVKHMTEAHGGTVRAESEGEGRGTTFIVMLPLLDTRLAQAAPTSSTEADRPDGLEGVRVLIVEDHPDTRDLMSLVLQGARADVVAVASASEALKVLGQLRPHVIVSDIGLPGEDGYDLLRQIRLREAESGDETPAVAVTALSGSEDRDRALAAGYQRHLPKPLDTAILTRVVIELARRRAH